MVLYEYHLCIIENKCLKGNQEQEKLALLLENTQGWGPGPTILINGEKHGGKRRGASHHLPDRFFDFEEPLDDFLGFFIRWYLRASSLSGTAAFPGAGGSILQGTIREAQVSSQKGAFEEGWKKAKGLPIEGWSPGMESGVSTIIPGHLPSYCSWKGENPTESSSGRRPISGGNQPVEQSEGPREGERDFNVSLPPIT